MTMPVLILENLSLDGPAYLGSWLRRHSLRYEVRNSEAGDAFPSSLAGYSALAILGGDMCANDDLPSLRQAERLILEGVALGVPVIGHCLGGQLMSRALGGAVGDSPLPEVGWHEVAFERSATGEAWFGELNSAALFQWHYDAFSLPEGAAALAGNDASPVQAFAIGPHLAMQFHIELDAKKLDLWLEEPGARYEKARESFATVQDVVAMQAVASARLAAQHSLADRVYARWMSAART